MRRGLLILLFIELLAALALQQCGRVESPAMARAWMEWLLRPTPETRREYERYRCIVAIEGWAMSGVVFAVMAGASLTVYGMRKAKHAVSEGDGRTAGGRLGMLG